MPLLDTELWIQIAVALLCGAVIGLERQMRHKAIGIRTSILVCLGTQTFVSLGVRVADEGGDPTRVLGQVVTGVGFLGAGLILARGEVVTGVTSAAVVWMLAAIGASVGLGYVSEALVLSGITVAVLVIVRLLEHTFEHIRRGSEEPDKH